MTESSGGEGRCKFVGRGVWAVRQDADASSVGLVIFLAATGTGGHQRGGGVEHDGRRLQPVGREDGAAAAAAAAVLVAGHFAVVAVLILVMVFRVTVSGDQGDGLGHLVDDSGRGGGSDQRPRSRWTLRQIGGGVVAAQLLAAPGDGVAVGIVALAPDQVGKNASARVDEPVAHLRTEVSSLSVIIQEANHEYLQSHGSILANSQKSDSRRRKEINVYRKCHSSFLSSS